MDYSPNIYCGPERRKCLKIFRGILSVPHNSIIDLNNVMSNSLIPYTIWVNKATFWVFVICVLCFNVGYLQGIHVDTLNHYPNIITIMKG